MCRRNVGQSKIAHVMGVKRKKTRKRPGFLCALPQRTLQDSLQTPPPPIAPWWGPHLFRFELWGRSRSKLRQDVLENLDDQIMNNHTKIEAKNKLCGTYAVIPNLVYYSFKYHRSINRTFTQTHIKFSHFVILKQDLTKLLSCPVWVQVCNPPASAS